MTVRIEPDWVGSVEDMEQLEVISYAMAKAYVKYGNCGQACRAIKAQFPEIGIHVLHLMWVSIRDYIAIQMNQGWGQ